MLRLRDFGFQEGVNEVIAITFGRWINTAPIGVIVEDPDGDSALIRLFRNHTRENVERSGKIWVNVNYDPIVWAKSSFEDLDESWFRSLDPPVIKGSVAWCEFTCRKIRSGEPSEFKVKLLRGGVTGCELRPVNRGFNALIEALVYGTRYVYTGDERLLRKIKDLKIIVEKCGGQREREAFVYMLNQINLSTVEELGEI